VDHATTFAVPSWLNCWNTNVHPQPYKLSWIQKDGDLVVSQQMKVNLSIGYYFENVLCDLVPLEACNILLQRPW